jgi:putative ABC transport system permease protein
LFVESILISVIGGAAGLIAANWGIRGLRVLVQFNEYVTMMSADLALDHRVLAFTCLISIGSVLVFGLAPAIRVSAADPQSVLRHGGRSGDLRRSWGRNLLVGCQIALAVVLVTSAGLSIKATAEELHDNFGFDPEHVLIAPVSLSGARYREPARQIAFLQSVASKLEGAAGVEATGIANSVPFTAERRKFSIQGRPDIPGTAPSMARYFSVSPGQLAVLSIPLVQGRTLRDSDNAGAHRVALVNRVFADRYFPGESPIGRYIRVDHDDPAWSEIVGVVGNVKVTYGPKAEDPQIYESYLQVPPDPEMWISLRAAGDASMLARDLRSAIWAVDSSQPIGTIQTVYHLQHEEDGGNYAFDALLSLFAAVALLLAGIGVYGVVSYAVTQRTHEIGVRMALGAKRAHVLRAIVGQSLAPAVGGAVVGILASAPLPKLFEAMLQDFRVHGTPIYFLVPVLLIIVVLAAIYVPASRAAKVDPVEALRYE